MSGKAEKDKLKAVQEKHQTILCELLKLEDNKYCVDCDAKGPRWASWNLGVFLCIRCAGIHRNLGVHVSKVKSVNLDSWTPEQIVMVQEMGNRKARCVYEAGLPENFRRPQTDSAMEALIRAKYEQKKYIDKDWVPPRPSALQNSDGEHKEKKRNKSSLGELIHQESRSLSHIKNASDSRLSSSVKSRTRRDSSEPRSSTQTSTPATVAASRCHRDASPASTQQNTSNDALPPVELISLASPEPQDVSSSPTEFGNFVGVESLTLTSTVPASSAVNLTGLDSSVPVTSANKLATKDDIMALYGPSNNSTLCTMPGGMYMARPPMVAPQPMMHSTNTVLPNAAPMMMPAANASVGPVPQMSYGMYANYQPQMMGGYQAVPVDIWASQQAAQSAQQQCQRPQFSAGYTMSNQLWQ